MCTQAPSVSCAEPLSLAALDSSPVRGAKGLQETKKLQEAKGRARDGKPVPYGNIQLTIMI